MKTLKGVIKDWIRINGRVEGIAVWHADGVTLERALASPRPGAIANGHEMYTSPVVRTAFSCGGFEVIETKNSFYVLLGLERLTPQQVSDQRDANQRANRSI